MARPLFEIAREISADWAIPSPQAKAYLKGMYYLVGMDDLAADLNADTTVRMFLLYSKTWAGPVAERVKAELKAMRISHGPTSAELLQSYPITPSQIAIDGCEQCHASLGTPGKFVEGYTHWNKLTRMCMHCNYFLSPGMDVGDGALYFQLPDGTWTKLHGEPKAPPATAPRVAKPRPRQDSAHTFGFRLKFFGRKVAKKCASLARRCLRRSA